MNGCTALFSPNVEVLSVPDGNTVVVQRGDDQEEIVLTGIAAPGEGECLAEEARSYLQTLVPVGSEVELRDLEDSSAEVRDAEGESVNELMLDSGLVLFDGPVAPDSYRDWLSTGLYSDTISCTLPGQVMDLSADLDDLDDRDRLTAAATALVVAEARAIKKKIAGLAAEVERDSSFDADLTGAALILKTERGREGMSDDLERLTEKADSRIEELERAHGHQVEREADEAARKAEWEAGAAEREAAAEQFEADRQRILREREASSGGSSSGSDGYTGRRCYEPGGRIYQPC